MRARGRRQEILAKGRYLVTRQLFLLYFMWRDLLLGGSHHKLWSTFFFNANVSKPDSETKNGNVDEHYENVNLPICSKDTVV